MKREIYFDNAATTRPYEEVIRAANRMMTQYYNPSAIYGPAIEVSKQIEGVRRRILHAISAEKGNVIFTSGGTEASNSVIRSMPKFRVLISLLKCCLISDSLFWIWRSGKMFRELS